MSSDVSDVRNLIIIGSGPAGYTAAVYAARANLRPLVFEGAVTAGGALMNTTEVENFPGFRDGIMGPELMENMRAQAERFGAELVTDDVTAVDLTGPVKTVTDSEGNTYRAHAVILAMGSAYRELGLPDEKRLSGHGVSLVRHLRRVLLPRPGHRRRRRRRLRRRGGHLPDQVRQVGDHRAPPRRAARLQDHGRARLANDKIRFAWNSEVDAIHGDDKVTGVTLRDTVTGETRELPVTGVFVAIGHDPRNELVKGVVDLDDDGYVLVEGRTTLTNVQGVFACGDLVDHTYRQAITAAGSGCAAALDAERYLAAAEHAGEPAADAALIEQDNPLEGAVSTR